MISNDLQSAINAVSPGAWCVGVSGGADSVALLSLLRTRPDLHLHVAHLDHETRDGESQLDARFVESLCAKWKLRCTAARRSELEPATVPLPRNQSARFRRLRVELFKRVVQDNQLAGVILAHHADDQAETVLLRLLRGSGPNGLIGMSSRAHIGNLLIRRPLLKECGSALSEHLRSIDQDWREDASNRSRIYLRNRLRASLAANPALIDALISLAEHCRELQSWTRRAAPTLESRFPAAQLAKLPGILARESARRWLADQKVPHTRLDPACMARLLEMSNDAASPAKQQFPGSVFVRRRAGWIFAEES